MKKSVIFLLSPFIVCLTSYGQENVITGKIKNAENNEPMAYVNIGIKNKTAGTVSTIEGMYKLRLNEKITADDTVLFSHVGFVTQRYQISELKNDHKTILLLPENVALDEVVISSKKIELRPKKIGRSSKGLGLLHLNFYSFYEKEVDDRLSKERGMKLKIRKNCRIDALSFNITSNDFSSLKFRLNFYKIEDGLPTDLIVKKNIIFDIKDGYLGWHQVDLTPYDIYFNDDIKEAAVTIQWLESVKAHENSKYFAISTAGSPTHTAYFRDKAMDHWTKGEQNLSFYLDAMCE
ncbi:carboxypeptidase-like regulatory domain-containing protein [Fulvivirga sp. M361]|uniref:carboxypeptidase-like regulatory domain-containing protein n=1 Tax=Fulvivirga sp. M361 TaxID=2594266 RepID=UPI00117AFB94|nr:carboxypeptidase-like regulatory domain-containing protein [Fulvivirga sp. M361]TRX60069.1 carboxypeptidase-like regulatory domain-containing protein [Fulvivirga sp. M361]